MVATKHVCKCGKFEAWVGIGLITDPCPSCLREYTAKHSPEDGTILIKEVGVSNEVAGKWRKVRFWTMVKSLFIRRGVK